MKTTIVLLSLLAAFTACGQTGALSGDASHQDVTAKAWTGPIFGFGRPNEIKHGRFTYSGVFVQAVKTKDPLQLVNPAAPPEAGSVSSNVAFDAITQKPIGLKLFAISF